MQEFYINKNLVGKAFIVWDDGDKVKLRVVSGESVSFYEINKRELVITNERIDYNVKEN